MSDLPGDSFAERQALDRWLTREPPENYDDAFEPEGDAPTLAEPPAHHLGLPAAMLRAPGLADALAAVDVDIEPAFSPRGAVENDNADGTPDMRPRPRCVVCHEGDADVHGAPCGACRARECVVCHQKQPADLGVVIATGACWVMAAPWPFFVIATGAAHEAGESLCNGCLFAVTLLSDAGGPVS